MGDDLLIAYFIGLSVKLNDFVSGLKWGYRAFYLYIILGFFSVNGSNCSFGFMNEKVFHHTDFT